MRDLIETAMDLTETAFTAAPGVVVFAVCVLGFVFATWLLTDPDGDDDDAQEQHAHRPDVEFWSMVAMAEPDTYQKPAARYEQAKHESLN